MNKTEKDLLIKIARNQEPQDVFDLLKKGKACDSDYEEIVQNQIDLGVKKMHLPEPWNGHLGKAKIMIISSNPSIGVDEDFPTSSWSDDDIAEFFDNRFKNNSNGVSMYWKSIAKYAGWICPEVAGLDAVEILDKVVVSTEVVHCKSKSEIGVNACVEKEVHFLNEIVKKFSGEIVLIVGKVAQNFYESGMFAIPDRFKVAVIPHPNAHGITDEERRNGMMEQLG